MKSYKNWEDEGEYKHVSHKKKLNKDKYCKKNKIGPKQYGPHVYKEGSNRCILCGHKRKESKPNYGFE